MEMMLQIVPPFPHAPISDTVVLGLGFITYDAVTAGVPPVGLRGELINVVNRSEIDEKRKHGAAY